MLAYSGLQIGVLEKLRRTIDIALQVEYRMCAPLRDRMFFLVARLWLRSFASLAGSHLR